MTGDVYRRPCAADEETHRVNKGQEPVKVKISEGKGPSQEWEQKRDK